MSFQTNMTVFLFDHQRTLKGTGVWQKQTMHHKSVHGTHMQYSKPSEVMQWLSVRKWANIFFFCWSSQISLCHTKRHVGFDIDAMHHIWTVYDQGWDLRAMEQEMLRKSIFFFRCDFRKLAIYCIQLYEGPFSRFWLKFWY